MRLLNQQTILPTQQSDNSEDKGIFLNENKNSTDDQKSLLNNFQEMMTGFRKERNMDTLMKDFFTAWEDEIAAYQEVSLILAEQKLALIKWDIATFQNISQKAVFLISGAHKATNRRQDLMESLFLINDMRIEENSLKTVHNIFLEPEMVEKVNVFFKVFSNTLKSIDKLSAENKDLIKTGLELVGDNLEMIADIIDRERVYSRVGMISQKRKSIILNKRV